MASSHERIEGRVTIKLQLKERGQSLEQTEGILCQRETGSSGLQ